MELRVHVDGVVLLETLQEPRADEDLVEHLRVAFEDVRVALPLTGSLSKRLVRTPPSRIDVVSENSKSLMSPSTATLALRSAARMSSTKSFTIAACWWRCTSLTSDRRLEAAEQRVVAALRVEVVRDREEPCGPATGTRRRAACGCCRRRCSPDRCDPGCRGAPRPGWCRRPRSASRRRRRDGRRTRARGRCGRGSLAGCSRRAHLRPAPNTGSI